MYLFKKKRFQLRFKITSEQARISKGSLFHSRGQQTLLYPLTYWKLQNFQTVLDGKNWESAETVLEDLQTRCGITPWLDTLLPGIMVWTPIRPLTLEIGGSAVSLCHKNRAQITLYVCEALSSMIFVVALKLFRIVWTVNLA